MLFLINQYRILWYAITFGFKATSTKSAMSPRINEIKLAFLSYDTIFEQCCYMHRLGYIDMQEPTGPHEKHTIQVTDKGMQYAMDTRVSIVSGTISVLLSLLSLIAGFILGQI